MERRKVCGTAMGTLMAPGYANLFMGVLEESILSTAPNGKIPAFYRRFIDDTSGIWLHGKAAFLRFLEHANSAHPSIHFTFKFGQSVDYLDTVQTIDGDNISSDLYTKPTDTHKYLLPTSDHPPHIHRHLPYGSAFRLRAIISDDTRLEQRLSELTSFLIRRDCTRQPIEAQLSRVRAMPRAHALYSTRQRRSLKRIPCYARGTRVCLRSMTFWPVPLTS